MLNTIKEFFENLFSSNPNFTHESKDFNAVRALQDSKGYYSNNIFSVR